MKRQFLFLLLIVLVCEHSLGNIPATVERVRDLTLQGLDFAYNLDFASANKKFDEAILVEPLHPRPYLAKASLLFWRYLMSKNEADYESFLNLAEKTIEIAENYYDANDKDADVLVCLGTIYGERAFARGRAKSYFKAAWDGKKSYDYYVDALEVNSKEYDAYLGVGLYHYFVSFLPKPLQWMTSILGIEGNPELGIKEVRQAAEKGVYSKIEAQYYLSQFLPWFANDFDSGEKILKGLTQQYPANSLFSFTLSVWEIRRHDVQSARQRLSAIARTEKSAVIGVKALALYKLAECQFRLGEYIDARSTYMEFLQSYQDENYIATANYRIGICYEMSGERGKATQYYKHAASAMRRHGDDAYSARRAEERSSSPLSFADSMMIKAQNFSKSGKYAQAIELFSNIIQSGNVSSDRKAEAIYGLGEAQYEQGKYIESLKFFVEVSQTKVSTKEQWLLPWSYYQAGLCYLKLGDYESARKMFEMVDNYQAYDAENWLTFRTEREIKRLTDR
jgi:TolA-binding protein